jgi:hypothetical protein
VLNHAGIQIFGDSSVDFLRNHGRDVFGSFLDRAVALSEGGRRGTYGGSITYSHAFDDAHAMNELYRDMVGSVRKKQDIHSFVWKESNRVSNYIRQHGVDLDGLFSTNELIRFLMPIRNPIDCAYSCLKSGHFRHLDQGAVSQQPTIYEVISGVLAEHRWFQNMKKRYPQRFFSYFEYEMNRKTLLDIGRFLGLSDIGQWADRAARVFISKRMYEKPRDIVEIFGREVESMFSDDPALVASFLKFASDACEVPANPKVK